MDRDTQRKRRLRDPLKDPRPGDMVEIHYTRVDALEDSYIRTVLEVTENSVTYQATTTSRPTTVNMDFWQLLHRLKFRQYRILRMGEV